MSKPRYSIIPAGAVTDPNLEGRDLQVLCLLGSHSDKLGWVRFRNQGDMATQINCGRATLQRSLDRLTRAGWIEIRASVSQSGRAYAPHAYRVRMDHDDPQVAPAEFLVEAELRPDGCPPVGTLPAGGQGVPTHGGQGVPTYTRAHSDQVDQESDGGGDAGAREVSYQAGLNNCQGLISPEALVLAEEVAAIAGLPDPTQWPPGWCGCAMRVQAFLASGYLPSDLRIGAHTVMANKRDGPPQSIEYFKWAFAKARGQREQPVPSAINSPPEVNHAHAHRPNPIAAAAGRILRRVDAEIAEIEAHQACDTAI